MSEQSNLVAAMAYEERCAYHRQLNHVPAKSINADYVQYATLISYLGYHSYSTAEHLIGSSYEYLAGPKERKVAVEEVLELLSQPWRDLLVQLESYAPVAPQIVYFQILAAWASNQEETGAHAKASVDTAKHFIEQCLTFLEQIQEERAMAAEQANFVLSQQKLAAASAAGRHKRARNEAISDTIAWFVTFGSGLGVGWLLAQ